MKKTDSTFVRGIPSFRAKIKFHAKSIKVARVVNLKLVFADCFYNMVALLQNPIPKLR